MTPLRSIYLMVIDDALSFCRLQPIVRNAMHSRSASFKRCKQRTTS